MIEDIPYESLDDFIARDFVEQYGFRVRPKVQLGMRQWETSIEGHNLTFKYIEYGTALQFCLSGKVCVIDGNNVRRLYQEFFYIATQDQISHFHDNFIPWILTCLWEDNDL